jgi:hypothetical protein
MRIKLSVLLLCFGLLVAGSGFAQQRKITVDVPFEFSAGSTTLPSGQCSFVRSTDNRTITITSSSGSSAVVPVITRISKAIHTTPKDAHVVFDKVGEKNFVSEVWIPGIDGFALATTKESHEHRVLDTPSQ